MKLGFRHCFLLASLCLIAACAKDEPDDPGFHKPVVAGVVGGEIRTVGAYLDGVEEENANRLNREGDRWSNPEDF
ncbi:MAG: hypothetical protein K6B46_02230 [Opitutales bacterium]|nr:hypothetical protein [Opitutales bacterium]